MPDRVVTGTAVPVAVGAGMRAWRLAAPDARFGGLSALAFSDGKLIALTDSGVVVRFGVPQRGGALRIALHDLPGGPGSPLRKSARDSESLLADPGGRGWWVGFENRHSLWLFDRDFRHVLGSRRLAIDWPRNRGAESLVARADESIVALPELGGAAAGGALVGPAWTSDAARLPDGRLALLRREPTLTGLVNRVTVAAGAGKPARRIALRVGRLDNLEGMVAVRRPGGGTRLWLVSDDGFRPWLRTLLVKVDLPAEF